MNSQIKYPTAATRRAILSHSGNQCTFPTCTKQIFDRGQMLGQIAHIKARKPDGPRYDLSQTPEERNGFDNLIAVCHEHGRNIDDTNHVGKYTVSMLQHIKAEHEAKIEGDADRNWIFPPNTIVSGDLDGLTVHYWIGRNKKPRVYSEEQLAICNALMRLFLDFHDLHTTLKAAREIDEPMIKSLFQQRYAKVGDNSDGLLWHLFHLMAMVPEITFGEFLRFNVEGGDITSLLNVGAERLQDVIEGREKSFFSMNKKQRKK